MNMINKNRTWTKVGPSLSALLALAVVAGCGKETSSKKKATPTTQTQTSAESQKATKATNAQQSASSPDSTAKNQQAAAQDSATNNQQAAPTQNNATKNQQAAPAKDGATNAQQSELAKDLKSGAQEVSAAAKNVAQATEKKVEEFRVQVEERTDGSWTKASPIDVKMGPTPDTRQDLNTYAERVRQLRTQAGPETVESLNKLRAEILKDPAKFGNPAWAQNESSRKMIAEASSAPEPILQRNSFFFSAIATEAIPQEVKAKVEAARSTKGPAAIREEDRVLVLKDLNALVAASANREALEKSRKDLTSRVFSLMNENEETVRNYAQLAEPSVRGEEFLRADIARFQEELQSSRSILTSLKRAGKGQETAAIEKSITQLEQQLDEAKSRLSDTQTQMTSQKSVIQSHQQYQDKLIGIQASSKNIEACLEATQKRDEAIAGLADASMGKDLALLGEAYDQAVRTYMLSHLISNPQNFSNTVRTPSAGETSTPQPKAP